MLALDERISRTRCLAALGMSDQAMAEIQQVLSESPQNSEAWVVSAVVHAMEDRRELALEAMRRARQAGVTLGRLREEWPLRDLAQNFGGK
jgi:Tfp pilus assembly protein PilF